MVLLFGFGERIGGPHLPPVGRLLIKNRRLVELHTLLNLTFIANDLHADKLLGATAGQEDEDEQVDAKGTWDACKIPIYCDFFLPETSTTNNLFVPLILVEIYCDFSWFSFLASYHQKKPKLCLAYQASSFWTLT
ncbi:hypothetical protein GOBAR_AA31245 [Gossypium barbadense]|uniref:Uncharacterized protein n=1 Tax=Gossypium barbadense TaxID=3634 RepID=A0A2P5WEE1_GOSBA|nr:hypothetical protein GOBAR_AA31245 [Gossypium barbadense]